MFGCVQSGLRCTPGFHRFLFFHHVPFTGHTLIKCAGRQSYHVNTHDQQNRNCQHAGPRQTQAKTEPFADKTAEKTAADAGNTLMIKHIGRQHANSAILIKKHMDNARQQCQKQKRKKHTGKKRSFPYIFAPTQRNHNSESRHEIGRRAEKTAKEIRQKTADHPHCAVHMAKIAQYKTGGGKNRHPKKHIGQNLMNKRHIFPVAHRLFHGLFALRSVALSAPRCGSSGLLLPWAAILPVSVWLPVTPVVIAGFVPVTRLISLFPAVTVLIRAPVIVPTAAVITVVIAVIPILSPFAIAIFPIVPVRAFPAFTVALPFIPFLIPLVPPGLVVIVPPFGSIFPPVSAGLPFRISPAFVSSFFTHITLDLAV